MRHTNWTSFAVGLLAVATSFPVLAGSAAAEEDFEVEVLRGTRLTLEGPDSVRIVRDTGAEEVAAEEEDERDRKRRKREDPRETTQINIYNGGSYADGYEPYYGRHGLAYPIGFHRRGHKGVRGDRGNRVIHHR
jgi:hypothetical protein